MKTNELKNFKGYTLIEFIVATGCLAVLVVLVFSVFSYTNKGASQAAAYGDVQQQINDIAISITRMGFGAGDDLTTNASPACVSPTTNVISCKTPTAPGYTERRFIFQAGSLTEETKQGSGAWQTRSKFPFVTGFVICGETAFQANSCSIPGSDLNTLHRTSASSKRYFRFQITAQSLKGARTYTGTANRENNFRAIGAVYLRNPGAIPNVSFVVGRKL